MDKYKKFSIEDFLQDEFFYAWVKDPFYKDAQVWEEWLHENPEMLKVVEQSKNRILVFDQQSKLLPQGFYIRIKNRIDETVRKGDSKKAKNVFIPFWLKLTAVILGLLIVGSILFYSPQSQDSITYTTGNAESRKVVLPDGSEVVLNANSSLKYIDNQITKYREVWLNGEGFFYIKQLKDKDSVLSKFIVHTREVNVEVLGTQFNVNSDETETKVLLTKGRVRLSVAAVDNSSLDINPDDMVLYNSTTKHLTLRKVKPANYLAWMDHKYIFEKTTLEDLGKELYRYYGKPVSIRDAKLRKQRLSGTLELQNEAILIQTLSVLLGVPVSNEGNQIIIGSEQNF